MKFHLNIKKLLIKKIFKRTKNKDDKRPKNLWCKVDILNKRNIKKGFIIGASFICLNENFILQVEMEKMQMNGKKKKLKSWGLLVTSRAMSNSSQW